MVDKPINGFINGFKEPPGSNTTTSYFGGHHHHLPQLDQEALVQLEALTSELYHSDTGNERRRTIENILREFSQSPDSWQVAFVYFERTTNFYAKTFCLYVIEQFVSQRWPSVPGELRTQFRTRLWNYLVEWHHSLSSSTRNKLCTIMATIARFDWPYSYPDFMSNVLDLVAVSGASADHLNHSHSSLMQLGLTLLGTTVDELTSPSSQHYHHGSRAELAKLLESHLSPMITALSTLLQVIVSKHINYISATPPPSPSNSPPDAFSTLNKATDTLGTVFERSIKKNLLTSIPFMDQEMVQMAMEILTCLHKIITFMPSAQCYTTLDHSLVSSLFVFASFGAVNPSCEAATLGLYAMDCINELMAKASRFDTDANDFIFNVFQKTFLILSQVVLKCLKSAERSVPAGDEMDENYLKRFVLFLKLFITGHLGRFEKFIIFPISDFLGILLDFTAKAQWHSTECYLLLLDTWMAYLDHLETCLAVKSKTEQSAVTERLQVVQKPIFTLLQFVLASIQYSFSREHLQQLDDREQVDEEGRTEYEHFIHHSIEVVAKVAEIFPEETIVYLDSDYLNEKLNALYYGLDFVVNNNNKPLDQMMMKLPNGHKLFPVEMCQQPLAQLQLSIHDFITMLQAFSRFSCFVVDHRFERYLSRTKIYFEKLFEILRFVEVHNLCDNSAQPLLCEFYLLKAQIIATWKAYIVWWQQYCCSVEAVVEPLTTIFNQCCSIICDNLVEEIPTLLISSSDEVKAARLKMFHSAALTLNTFSANVRPSFVFALPSVQRLFDQELQARLLQLNCEEMDCRVTLTDQILISQSISNLLILPWTSQEAQDWETRSHALRLFIGNFVQLFNKLEVVDSRPQSSPSVKCPNVYCRSLYILRKVIKSHKDSPLKSKQIVLHALNSSLEAFIQLLLQNNFLYSTRTGCQITSYILALFVVAFNVLLSQIHIDFVKRTIETLLGIINRQDVNTCTSGVERSVPVVQVFVKFLKLLSLIIKQTSFNPALRPLLPQIIDLTVCHIHATMIDPKSPVSIYFRSSDGAQYEAYHRLLRVYYKFLYELLANNCRYFFPQSHVMSKLSGSSEFSLASVLSSSKGGKEEEEPRRYFDSIMKIFGESFLHPEKLELYGQNVEALESLNVTIKLYGRPAFRREFWHNFLYLFVQSLLDHSLSLFDELLHGTVYHLAEVDFAEFYEQFVPKFVAQVPRLTDAQRIELVSNFKQVNGTAFDQPTFHAKLSRLLCEIRFYHKCNTHI